MEAIPEPLVKFALGLLMDMDCYGSDLVTTEGREHDARLVAAALLAERIATREACARIAEDEDGHFSQWGEDRNSRVAQQTCKDIAAAIRSGKE